MDVQERQELLSELTRRVVSSVHPERLLLFGSAAREQMGPHSDFDVLVVMHDGVHRGNTCKQVYRALAGFGFAVDVIVVTDQDIRDYGTDPFRMIKSALEEGIELYHAAA